MCENWASGERGTQTGNYMGTSLNCQAELKAKLVYFQCELHKTDKNNRKLCSDVLYQIEFWLKLVL